MAPYRRSCQSRSIATTTSHNHPSSNRNFDDDEMSNDEENFPWTQEDDSSRTEQEDEEIRLKSNVWTYAKKISSEKAQCIRCKSMIKTVHGGTTTLRKHLITKHNLTHLILPTSERQNKQKSTISREQKIRLDYLANLAIYEDGRTFNDLHKSGIRKFLAEAIPGNRFC